MNLGCQLRLDVRLISMMLAAVFVVPRVADCDDGRAYIEAMTSSWDRRERATRTLRAEWTETTMRSGSGTEQQAEQQRVVFTLGAQGKTRIECHPMDMDKSGVTGGASRKGTAISSFDGERNYNFTSAEAPDDWPRGIRWSEAKNDEGSSCQIRPWLLHLRPSLVPAPILSPENLQVVATDISIDGHKCAVIEARQAGVLITGAYWIDTARDYLILRYNERFNDKTTVEINIDYKEADIVGWIPTSWDATFVNGQFAIRDRLIRHEINPGVPDATFEIDFPAGTIVFDRDHGYRALQLGGGKTRIITPEESANGFSYKDLFDTVSGDLAQPLQDVPRSTVRWTVLVAINALLVLALLARFIWQRRQSPHGK